MQELSGPAQPGNLDMQSMDQETGASVEEVTKEDLQAQWQKQYEAMPYKELAARMVELKTAIGEADRMSAALTAEFDVIRLRVVPNRFAEEGMTSLRIAGIGRLGLTKDAYCNRMRDSSEEEFFDLLRELGYGDMIKETVNPSSLKSAVKELFEDHNNAVAEQELDLANVDAENEPTDYERVIKFVNFTPFMRAAITKG